MKTLRLHGMHDIRLHEEKSPVLTRGKELLKVKSVGICGSDLHWFSEQGIGDSRLSNPLILGHEFSAVIDGGERNGERVAVDPSIPCGKCEYCLRGHPNLCPDVIFAGHGSTDGALRENMVWNSECLFTLPSILSDDDGAMLEPLGVAIHAVDLAHIRTGMTIGVFGCGPIGLLIIQLARLSGAANILAADKLPHRLDAARALGANHVILVDGQPVEKQILSLTNSRGTDISFDAAGEQAAVNDAVNALIPGGKLILAGIPSDDQTILTASTVRRKGLTIKLVRRMKLTYPRAIDLVSRGLVDVKSLVTAHFSMEQAAEAFVSAEKREGLKIIIKIA